jgi:hypothetical protein
MMISAQRVYSQEVQPNTLGRSVDKKVTKASRASMPISTSSAPRYHGQIDDE